VVAPRIVIFRGWAAWAFGTVTVSSPFAKLASI
jgi:hypothetical protein